MTPIVSTAGIDFGDEEVDTTIPTDDLEPPGPLMRFRCEVGLGGGVRLPDAGALSAAVLLGGMLDDGDRVRVMLGLGADLGGITRFDEVNEYGVYNDPLTVGPAYIRVHHNWFYDVLVSAISLEDADRCHVYENWLYNFLAATANAGTVANCLIDFTNGGRNLVHHNTLSCVLPAAVVWDYDATCTAGGTDSWNSNLCMNGPSVTNPA